MVEPLEKLTDEYFSRGMTLDEYLGKARNYRSFIRDLVAKASAKSEHSEALKTNAKDRGTGLRATVNTEDWCGDWASNAAYLGALFSAAGIEMRIFRGSEHPEIRERYERDGDSHIPAVSLWDDDGREVARWIEAPATISAQKDAWKAENPHFLQTYKTKDSDPDAKKAWPKMYKEFMDMMAGWYVEGGWDQVAVEIISALEDDSE